MRLSFAVTAVAAFLLQATAYTAEETRLSENFETGYALADAIDKTGALSYVLGPIDTTTSQLVAGVTGVVTAGIPQTGGSFSGMVTDTSTAYGGHLALTNSAILALNDGNGIQKGSVQVDVTVGAIEYSEININDGLEAGTSSVGATNNHAGHIRLVKNSAAWATRNAAEAQTTGTGTVTIDTTYRIKFVFDNSTKTVTTTVHGNAPTFDQEMLNHTGTFRSANAAFPGVRYLTFATNNPNVQPMKFDNITIIETVADPEPAAVVEWSNFK